MTEEEKETPDVNEEIEVNEPKRHNPWRVVLIIFCAVALLIGISFIPFERLSRILLPDISFLLMESSSLAVYCGKSCNRKKAGA